VDFFVKYHNYLYGKDKQGKEIQPAENSNGRTDGQLVQYATDAGIPADAATTFSSCVQTEQYKALVAAMTEKASEKGINSTPTILVNGKQLKDHTWATLSAAIDKADQGFTPSPSPSASSSASSSAAPSSSVSPSPTG
jgi:protein-disulfide isomerase